MDRTVVAPTLEGRSPAEQPAEDTTVGAGTGDTLDVPPTDRRVAGTGPVEYLRGRWLRVAQVGLVVTVAAGVALRFWTSSAMWLDEALTVDIARLPLHEIPSYLRRDGAPPLYYVLLHFWMKVFGSSDLGVRSLSGALSVATLPVAWLAGRRFGGRPVAWVLLALLASAPFAVYYGTEARMYSLVMLETACGFVALGRVLERPRPGNLVALAVVVAALLYSQYWAVYLVGSLGLWLLWQAWRGREAWRSSARWAIVAVAGGVVLFLPWVPTFVYQARYTGTPWAKPPNFAAIINAVTGFTDNQATLTTAGSNQGRLLALGYFALVALALFGVARDNWHIDLDLRGRRRTRGLTFVVVCTLAAAITGGIVTGSAFSPRYAAVVFVPLLVLVAYGAFTMAHAGVRTAVVAVLVLAGLAGSVQNVYTQRSQAPQVASVLAAQAKPGDIVAFCPDQLGPGVYRLVGSDQTDRTGSHGRYTMLTFPRGTGPAFVDWVDYKTVAESTGASGFADRLQQLAGHDHAVWLVHEMGYQGFGDKCTQVAGELAALPGYGARNWVAADPDKYYEPMDMTEFTPPAGGSAAGS
ncbi:MAG: glycosyltransferase family 39 protein [Acidimicrobiales bacterium]